jgi:hypothetical protein
VIEVLRQASLETFAECQSYFWPNGEKKREAFGIADTFLHELEVLKSAPEKGGEI